MPVAGLHAAALWHWSGAAQTTGFAPLQTPPVQVSVWVQALPSLQALPSDLERVPRDAALFVSVRVGDLWAPMKKQTGRLKLERFIAPPAPGSRPGHGSAR